MWVDRFSEISDRPRVARVVWLATAALISLLHLFVHTINLSYGDLPLDDAGTWGVARRPLFVVLTLPTEFHSQPPLYYIVLHFLVEISSAPWFLRGFSWLCVLLLLQFILFTLHELTLLARTFLCLVLIFSHISNYLATAVRPYGMAALLTVVSSVMLVRALQGPTRRRAVAYGLATVAMLYTMAFEVAVLLAHGLFVMAVCLFAMPKLGWRAVLARYRTLLLALVCVVVAYVPYLLMAIHYQYKSNATKTMEKVLELGTYQNAIGDFFRLAGPVATGVYALGVLGLVGELRARNRTVLLWPLIAVLQIAFVWFFMVGRGGVGVQTKYMMPAFVAIAYLAAIGFDHPVPTTRRATWVVVPLLLVWLVRERYDAFAVYMETPAAVGPFGLLSREMAKQPGKKIIFFDVGYDGQHLEYVVRDDPNVITATMPGPGWASGGAHQIDGAYVSDTIERNAPTIRCFFYYHRNPNGPHATAFLPKLKQLGYKELPPLPSIHGRSVPGFCREDR